MKGRWAIPPLLLAACLALAIPEPAAADEPASADEPAATDAPPVTITGTKVLPPEVAREAAGVPPPDTANLEKWAAKAVGRIVAAYKAKGYTFARAWSGATPDGQVLIDVDEGRMSGMVFLGASPQQTILFRVDVVLPNDIFHLPTLQHGLADIKKKYRLLSVEWRVVDREELIPNRLGEPIALRGLRIIVARKDRQGWSVAADLDPTFGLVPSVSYQRSLLWRADDRLRLGLSIGVPYRRYLFDAQPRWTWVYGELAVTYRMGTFVNGRLTPSFEATGILARYSRADLGLATFLAGRWSTYANLQVHVVRDLLSMSFAFGLGDTHVFDVSSLDPKNTGLAPPPGERTQLRYLFRLQLELDETPDLPVAGRKRNLQVQAELAVPNSGLPLLTMSLDGRYVFSFGYHDLLLQGRGLYLLGKARFWDDQTLAGECQRVYFGNRYWVRHAAQLEVAARFGVWEDKVKLGLFHDLSVFADRSRTGHPTTVVNGFGPSVHFLIWDQFLLDLYYGFGFAPSVWDHNFSLALRSTF